ncbi:MAG: pantoate--beta-alanine ligase [Methylococcaceae bacterium]|nr:pantoate--beta-alanine ligase [Methylococcaceae bacterium]
MQIVETIVELQQVLRRWREAGENIAFVPTMGNLHAGHISLVNAAHSKARRVVVSIFVNPTQFGPEEDYDAYPRTLEADTQQLREAKVDLLFLPTKKIMYPAGASTQIIVTGLSEHYCGASRPGHFSGVATVVAKLFNIVQPDIALFGEKDFQQLTIIRKMVGDLNIPVILQGIATVREADGLALSSRNSYLTSDQRKIAPLLYQSLCQVKARIMAGESDYATIEAECCLTLKQAGFEPDYIAICREADLQPAQANDTHLMVLAAARLGKPRLIDNIAAKATKQ